MYQVVSKNGTEVRNTPVATSRGQMMHDFGITRNFAVFVEQALVFDPAPMFISDTLPITLDTEVTCRHASRPPSACCSIHRCSGSVSCLCLHQTRIVLFAAAHCSGIPCDAVPVLIQLIDRPGDIWTVHRLC